jgi:hypothetical protein
MSSAIQIKDFPAKPKNQKIVNLSTISINSNSIVSIRNNEILYRIVIVKFNGDKYTISARVSAQCCEYFGEIYSKLELDDETDTPHYNCFPTDKEIEENVPDNFVNTVENLPNNFINTEINLKEIRIYELSVGCYKSNSKLIYEFVLDNGKRYFLGHYNFHNGNYPRDINITLKEVSEENEIQILQTCI